MAAFTTIAAAAGLAATAATTASSFAQMSKQGKLQKQAEADAAKAMAEARKKLEVNFYDQLSIKKEPYELAREAALAAGAQAIEAGRESERGAAATAGRVQMAQTEEQRKIATAMGEEMSNLEKLSATEDARLRDIGVQLDVGEAEGAQRAARDAAEAKAAATKQAMEGITSMGQQVAQLAPLYGKNTKATTEAMGGMSWSPEQYESFGNVKNGEKFGFGPTQSGVPSNLDFDAIGKMNKNQFSNFYGALTPQQRQMLFTHPQFEQNYNAFALYK
jgi:colicin import membrane protein